MAEFTQHTMWEVIASELDVEVKVADLIGAGVPRTTTRVPKVAFRMAVIAKANPRGLVTEAYARAPKDVRLALEPPSLESGPRPFSCPDA
ncbi:hypothetical protein [Agromyces sp. NPDC058064]|uniref:hypothetical protein n=1 Tax=Agromyces sp. NPDC058064 TaxID=3346322 RepID=UPI0036DA86CB